MTKATRASTLALALLLVACVQEDRDLEAPGGGGAADDGAEDGEDGAPPEDGDDGDGVKFDVAEGETDPGCGEGEDCDDPCEAVEHEPCDENTDDPVRAMGLNCPGELPIEADVLAAPGAIGVLTGFGPTDEWDPTEGHAMAIIGSGLIEDLAKETPDGDLPIGPTHCNDDLGMQWDMGTVLPMPLQPVDVDGDCSESPDLVGTGDCSNSVQKQFDQGISANDYTEIRFKTTVPGGSESISYDLAFFSTEYPYYWMSEFNDMYVGWLESDRWTGNISFDEAGNPISLNASFLDFRDDYGDMPELQGTCMRTHAATEWLTTTAPVKPGEEIELVFAIFDLSDSILDSYVLLDNFQWGCEGPDQPETVPQG